MLGYCKIIVDKEHSYVLSLNVLLHYVSNILILYDLWGVPVYKHYSSLISLPCLPFFHSCLCAPGLRKSTPDRLRVYGGGFSRKITVLSYPKYHRDSSGNLQKTETQLVPLRTRNGIIRSAGESGAPGKKGWNLSGGAMPVTPSPTA